MIKSGGAYIDGVLAVLKPLQGRRWSGIAVAILAVAAALLAQEALQPVGQFYYLPLVPPVIVTALVAGRWAVATAIALSIAFNVLVTPRSGLWDTVMNAALYAGVSWWIAGVCRSLRDALRRSQVLSDELRARETVLSAVLASAPVVTVNAEGCVRHMTPTAGVMLETDAASAEGRTFASIMEGFDPGLLEGLSTAVVLEPTDRSNWASSGPRSVPLAVVAAPLPTVMGEERFVISLADQSRAQAEREEALDLHGRLSHVWRLNSMGQLAATLAHELNQPLTAATVYLHASQADIARAGPLGDSAARSLELAKTQLLRAGAIIRRMRDLVSAGEQTLDVERVRTMINDLKPILSLITRDSDVPITLDIPRRGDEVLADRIQIQQAVTNLVRNAVEAVAGRPSPMVAVIGRVVDDATYEIRVEDNGPGIEPERIEDVLRPNQSNKSGGMGLGLAVTRSIVESHDSRLEVSRSAGGGAAFAFRLKRNPEPEGS